MLLGKSVSLGSSYVRLVVHAIPHFAYAWISSVKVISKGGMVQGFFFSLGSHRQDTCVLKEGEGISDFVRYPRDVAGPDKEILCFIERSTRNLRGSIIRGALFELPEFIMATTVSLLHQN